MHTMDSNTSNVPAFIVKLWKIVEDNAYDSLICWNNNGRSFIIHNQSRFAKELLPLYFKHNNMASFIRQLNMYGFRKVTNIENSGLRSENDDIEFFHPYFTKGQESLLENIKRKTSLKSSFQISTTGKNNILIGALKHEEVADILADVENIRGKQESVDNHISNMRKENELLWKEVAILRHKHHKQQQIVEKLIQFLVSLVHNRGMVGVKRKMQLMINDSEDCRSDKSMKSDDEYDFGSSSNSKGPIIHDITDISEDEVNLLCNSPLMTTTVNVPNVTSPNPDSTSQINDNLLPNSNQTVEPLNLLDPLQATIQELGLVADVDDTNSIEDINENVLSVDNLLQSSLSTPPGSPSTSHINFFENNTNDTKPETKDLVISSLNESDPSNTISLNEHVTGIEAELDLLQKLFSENIDTATLYGVGLEDFSLNSKLFSLDDPYMSSSNMPTNDSSHSIIGNEVVQFNPVNSNTSDLFDDLLDTIVEENVENVVVADDCEKKLNDLRRDSLKDENALVS